MIKTQNKKIVDHIKSLKNEFTQFANPKDKDFIELRKKESELTTQFIFFSREEQEEWKIKNEKLKDEVSELKKKYEIKQNTLYKNAFEWRYEFPEVYYPEIV